MKDNASLASAEGRGQGFSWKSGQTWVEQAGQIYGAKPDQCGPIGGGSGYTRSVTGGDCSVATLEELLAALAQAQTGQTIFIDPAAQLDLTDRVFIEKDFSLKIPAGVTLASSRGQGGASGALIYSDAFQSRLLEPMGPGVRITGLRLRGPDPKRRLVFHHRVFYEANGGGSEAYYRVPNSDAVVANYEKLEVDNCELSACSHSGIFLREGSGHHVHHNFFHHIQRMGLGYGVCVYKDSKALIDYNLFQDNKHHVASSGMPGCGYEACHNVVLPYTEAHIFNGKPYGQDHLFDMHGGRDRQDGTDIAGAWLKVHHNTFMSDYLALHIRGVPQEEAVIEHNWFYASGPESAVVESDGKTVLRDNVCGPPPQPVLGGRQVDSKTYKKR